MDDAPAQPTFTVPALLLYAAAFSNAFVGFFNLLPGMPLDGGQILESAVWAATGSFVLSAANPFWFSGSVAAGIGSPHTLPHRVWPIALAVEGLVSGSASRRRELLDVLVATDAGTGDMHESFDVDDPTQFSVVAQAFQDRPGVEEVQDQKALLEGFFSVLNKLQLLALIIAAVQVLAAVLLISNTIRVAAYSRRRETGIMRLVGASNLYIQLPFLLEGVLAAVVGAALASGALVALKAVLIEGQLRPNFPVIAYVSWSDVLWILPWLFATGVVLAGLSSFITLQRHLRV